MATSSTFATTYPAFTSPYIRGKLPPVKSQHLMKMCSGRVLIFLILGVLLFVLGLISVGVYLNIDGLTSSTQYTEIMPLFVTSGAVILSGICVSFLFWRRFKVAVFVTVVVCVSCGFLCGITAVLTCTHILQPLQSFTSCRYYMSQKLCQCFSPYKRDMLSLQYSDTEDTKYDFEDVSSCEVIERTLPHLLYALVGVYGLVFLLCTGSAILALLVLRAERIKQRFLGDESYEEVYTVSGSSQDQSDSEPEIATEVTTLPKGQTLVTKNSLPVSSGNNPPSQRTSRENSVTQNLSTGSSSKIGPLTPQSSSQVQNGVKTSVCVNSLTQGQRSRTPGPNDLGKESLASRYRINKTPDNFTVRQRLSKTPDREIGSSRRYSFSGSRRLSKSCDSLDSSGSGSRELLTENRGEVTKNKKNGKLREHRRKGKRAATIHTLDTDQLLLILNLQMRYLQESREQQARILEHTNSTSVTYSGTSGSRRAITPQPVSQKTVIPQKVRSHTPQPRRANQRSGDLRSNTNITQVKWSLGNRRSSGGNVSNSENSSRRTSESSERNLEFVNTGLMNQTLKQAPGDYSESSSYLHSQQMCKTIPNVREGYNPYIHTHFRNSSAENVHFVTYSDSMLNNLPAKPKSRASVQGYFLPPEPVHRTSRSHHQLPSQPVTRQRSVPDSLPPQPVRRGSSAFHVVDRNKSRSPSVCSDKDYDGITATPKRRTRRDYADLAVRENFTLNTRPFIIKDNSEASESPVVRNRSLAHNEENVNFILRRDRNYTAGNPPPYSGPPSYKDHVSSCQTSVTSSLSSNPDDYYSFPKRRVQTEPSFPSENLLKKAACDETYVKGGANYSGFSEPVFAGLHQQLESEKVKVEGHTESPKGREVIYSAPAKSKVKQFIVPEDYYSSVCKVTQKDPTYANEIEEFATAETFDLTNNEERLYGNSPQVVNFEKINSQGGRKREDPDSYYGNVPSSRNGGLQFSYNPGIEGQIAPDAKYDNEYEDVYDTPENVPDVLPQQKPGPSVHRTSYSVNTHGISSFVNDTRSKSKSKSPKKNKSPYPVASVHANVNMTNSMLDETNKFLQQTTESVQNVHAKNVNQVPLIKLNDQMVNVEDGDDDDVFLDDAKIRPANQNDAKIRPANQNVVEHKGEVHKDQDYQEILDFESTSENQGSGHMVFDLTSEETDTGYMKMSLPEKGNAVPDISLYMKQAQISDKLEQCGSTNQQSADSHVTNNQSTLISGESKKESMLEGEEYQETGV